MEFGTFEELKNTLRLMLNELCGNTEITQGFVGQGKNRESYLECNGQLLNSFFFLKQK